MHTTTSSPQEREQRFRELYDAAYVDLLRFVRRRVHVTHAEDVVGDVMLVAWRRLDDVPTDLSSARAWLFGVARKILQNTRRRDDRQDAVAVRLAEVRHGPADAGQHPDLVAHRVDIAAAWPRLSASHQEVIALSVLDGLTAPEAAAVLDISPTAFRLRLSRARRTLRRHVDSATTDVAGRPGFRQERTMNKHADDTMTTAALRDLDPAATTALTDDELAHADATLTRILATPSQGHVPAEPDRPRRRRSRLLVPLGVAGAAAVAIPGLLLGGGSAFASWTPKPEPLSPAAAREAAGTCRALLEVSDQGERAVIAERRGGWTYLLLAGPHAEAACLMPDELVRQSGPGRPPGRGILRGLRHRPRRGPDRAA